jgi:preprotein translocase subunit SecA
MPAAIIDDKVWWNLERKLAGILDETAASVAEGRNVLLLAHFENTLTELGAALRARQIEHERFATSDSARLCGVNPNGRGKVWIGPVPAFPPSKTLAIRETTDRTSPRIPVEVIVAEHHPLRSRDEQVWRAADTLSCKAQVTFHISLDDPLLVHFGVSSIQHLFKQLGMSEETFLSNSLITNAIRRAQEKIEKETPKDLPAHSIADWFKYNKITK